MTDTEKVNPGSHQDGEADVLLVVSMAPEFFTRLVDAGNAGDFKQLVALLPWSKSYTSRLRKVGLELARFVSHAKQLPTDSTTLYHLARL